MEISMKLFPNDFENVKSGKKTRDYRLYDEKRRELRVGDTILFRKLPNLDEEFLVEVTNIVVYPNWYECYAAHFDEDFKAEYESVEDVVEDTYNGGYYTKEESDLLGCVVIDFKKKRIVHHLACACYLVQDEEVLMLKYRQKWDHVYTPPGGKVEKGESPLDCVLREYEEETGVVIKNVRLQGISYYTCETDGCIFIYTASEYEGEIRASNEGELEWVKISDLSELRQFEQNQAFTPYLFQDRVFEGKFEITKDARVLSKQIRLT
ncbi:MAG: NUDIX domain-containing protein [Bacilli bacterium]|nr:NUDIX domain-containing protein [Bacilli bacterium]